jgi:hypothetical protein
VSQSDAVSVLTLRRPAVKPSRPSRPRTLRSATTNDPLRLPSGLDSHSSEGRRWRDLADAYAAQLGPERMKYDIVQTQLRSLLWLSIELERLQAERLADKNVPLHTVLHATQEVRALIAALGLSEAMRSDGESLHDVLRDDGGAP